MYNATSNAFIVDGDFVTQRKVGVWQIKVVVKYDETVKVLGKLENLRSKSFEGSFTLTIYEDVEIKPIDDIKEEELPDLPLYKYLPDDFQGQIILENQDDVDGRPTPYVVSFNV